MKHMFMKSIDGRDPACLLLTVLLPLVLLQGGMVTAAEKAEPAREPLAALAAADDDPKVCKRLIPTGSRIVRRLCLPKSEWEAMREDGQKAARDAIRDDSQVRYGPG